MRAHSFRCSPLLLDCVCRQRLHQDHAADCEGAARCKPCRCIQHRAGLPAGVRSRWAQHTCMCHNHGGHQLQQERQPGQARWCLVRSGEAAAAVLPTRFMCSTASRLTFTLWSCSWASASPSCWLMAAPAPSRPTMSSPAARFLASSACAPLRASEVGAALQHRCATAGQAALHPLSHSQVLLLPVLPAS